MKIQRLGDRIVLLLLCGLLAEMQGIDTRIIMVEALIATIIACMGVYVTRKWILISVIILYLLISVFYPEFVMLYPVLFYELFWIWKEKTGRKHLILVQTAMAVWMISQSLHMGTLVAVWVLLLSVLSGWLWHGSNRLESLQRRYIVKEDNSTEQTRELKNKNRYLLETQNSEINAAMLQERNRIAREIHDNVGHMLSRGILMTGAMLTIAKEPAVKEGLEDLKDCLDEAMNNIRESVHDLHDESIDLERSIRGLLRDLPEYQVELEYDMSKETPREIKYCLIAVVKEGISNIIKHSNGDRITIAIIEHPAFYRLSVLDNGTIGKLNREQKQTGIGLVNIQDRVEQLAGALRITAKETGFQIYVTLPKKYDMEGREKK